MVKTSCYHSHNIFLKLYLYHIMQVFDKRHINCKFLCPTRFTTNLYLKLKSENNRKTMYVQLYFLSPRAKQTSFEHYLQTC